MLARSPLPLWVVVSGFALSAAAVPLAGRWLRPPIAPPGTLTETIELLGQCEPPFHTVPVMEKSLESGVYLCERPWSLHQLQLLPRAPEYAHRWRGVVFCQHIGRCSEFPPEELQSWGEHGMKIGPLLFFGDPDLLRRVQRGIFQQAEAQP